MALKPVTVSQLNAYISRVLQTDPLLGNLSVVGEISNLNYHASGHVYFSMVDETSKINCFLPSSYAEKLQVRLRDGMGITVRGYINVYQKGGAYTLFVRTVEVSGEGDLAQAFQQLKEKLAQEGLFDPAHKKALPAYPKRIGVVTAKTGAAVQDILKIIQRRTRMTDVIVFPVQVQGTGAAEDIAQMLDQINVEYADIDLLIVGRGGGSLEDLWAFNEEVVARAIYRSRIPIISAVGHEIDFTIADFVADKRAETPTAAAEMAVPDTEKLHERLKWCQEKLLSQLQAKVRYETLSLRSAKEQINTAFRTRWETANRQLEQAKLLLNENHPKTQLARGYGILENADGQVVASVQGLQENHVYALTLQDGRVRFKITDLCHIPVENDGKGRVNP